MRTTFAILFLMLSLPCHAEESSIFCTTANGQAPRYLFHCTSYRNLQRLAQLASGARLPLGTELTAGKEGAGVLESFPNLEGRRAIFAWSHPTAAMAFMVTTDEDMPGEIYARAIDGHPPALLAMRIKPSARVKIIHSDGNGTKADKFDDVDLVLHIIDDGKIVAYREWILLNPDVVESFTADPEQLPLSISKEMHFSVADQSRLKDCEKFVTRIYADVDAQVKENLERAQSNNFRGELVWKLINSHENWPPIFSGQMN